MFTSCVQLPNNESPILLLHQKDLDTRPRLKTSRHNEAQSVVAVKLLKHFVSKMPKDAEIVALCLYSAEKEDLKEKLRCIPQVTVVTVDGFQANEADLTYVLTTRSVEKLDEETEKVLEFIQDKRRSTVALSRSRHGLVLHENLNTLAAGDVWRKFIDAAVERTYVINPNDYLNSLENSCPIPKLVDRSKPLWPSRST